MAASQFCRPEHRHGGFSPVRKAGNPIEQYLAAPFGRLATGNCCDPFSEQFSAGSYSKSLRDRAGHMGLSAIYDNSGSNHDGTSPSDKDLLSAILNQDGKNDDVLENLIVRFGDLTRVLLADFAELVSVTGSANEAKKIKAIFDMAARLAAPRPPNTITLSDCPSLVCYLQAAMGNHRVETLRVLFLDTHNRLIEDQVMWEGTVDEVQIHPREVLKRALEIDSSAFVLAHNHPSQIVTPSAADVAVTSQLIAASQCLGIAFHDHLIVSSMNFHSMRFHGTIEPWG